MGEAADWACMRYNIKGRERKGDLSGQPFTGSASLGLPGIDE